MKKNIAIILLAITLLSVCSCDRSYDNAKICFSAVRTAVLPYEDKFDRYDEEMIVIYVYVVTTCTSGKLRLPHASSEYEYGGVPSIILQDGTTIEVSPLLSTGAYIDFKMEKGDYIDFMWEFIVPSTFQSGEYDIKIDWLGRTEIIEDVLIEFKE